MINMIAFDLFGVIFSEGHMVSNTLMPLLPNKTSKTLVKHYYKLYTCGDIQETAFWQAIGQHNHSKLRKTFLNSFTLDHDVTKVLSALSPHFQLSILSNLGKDWGTFLIDKFQFQQHFSPIILSGIVGHEKPNIAIYQALITQSKQAAKHTLFIDDRLENLSAAHHLGMKTAYYQREKDSFNFQPDFQLQNLGDIIDLVCAAKNR